MREREHVLQLENITMQFGGVVAVNNLSLEVNKGEIVALIGPNGAGKTTLFKMLVGQEKPDAGTLTIGDTVQFAYVDQQRESLTPGKTVYELISDGAETIKLGNREINARAYCSRFNFTGSDQQKKVDVLSGGERNIKQLRALCESDAEILFLDEPSSHLDTYAQIALEKAIKEYQGTVLMVTHDFYTVANCADRILLLENGTVREQSGRAYRKSIYKKYFESDIFEAERIRVEKEVRIHALLRDGKWKEAKNVL